MKNIIFVTSLCMLIGTVQNIQAQVKIGAPGVPHSSAVLELDGGITRGLLLPRMTTKELNEIPGAMRGLMVYSTDDEAVYIRVSNQWVKMNALTDPFSLPYFGSFNVAQPVLSLANTNTEAGVMKLQNIAIGNANPVLEVLTNSAGINNNSGDGGSLFRVTNTSSRAAAIKAEINSNAGGIGTAALYGLHTGTQGNAGYFYSSNPAVSSATVVAINEGNGSGIVGQAQQAGSGLEGIATGSGHSLYAWKPNNTQGHAARFAVLGTGNTAAAVQITHLGSGEALQAQNSALAANTIARLENLNSNNTLPVLDIRSESAAALHLRGNQPRLQFFHKIGGNFLERHYIQQQGNNLVLRPNGQNTSGKIVFSGYDQETNRLFVDAIGNLISGIDPDSYGAHPSNARVLVRGRNNAITMALQNDAASDEGTSLGFYINSNNTEQGRVQLRNGGMNFRSQAGEYSWFISNQLNGPIMRLTREVDFLPGSGYLQVGHRAAIGGNTSGGITSPANGATLTLMNAGVGGIPGSNLLDLKGVNPMIRFFEQNNERGYIRTIGQNMFAGASFGYFSVFLNGASRMIVRSNGNVTIGHPDDAQPAGNHRLAVKGAVAATEYNVVNVAAWPDYVFAENYKLRSLEETEAFIQQHKHLPGIPAAAEIEANGLPLGDMQKRMMEKLEELTLHLIEADKRIRQLTEANALLHEKLSAISAK